MLSRTETVAETRSSFRDFFPTKGYVALHVKKLSEADRIWRMLAVKCHAGCKHPEQFASLTYSMCIYSALRKILEKMREVVT